VTQLGKFPVFYGTSRFITVFRGVHHWSLSWTRWFQPTSFHSTSLRFIPIAYTTLYNNVSVVWTALQKQICICNTWKPGLIRYAKWQRNAFRKYVHLVLKQIFPLLSFLIYDCLISCQSVLRTNQST
jgi:hypothetical protein